MAPLASIPEPSSSRREAFAALKAGLSADAIAAPRLALEDLIPTGIPSLDAMMGGGFPRGALVALEGRAGRWSIAVRTLAQVTRRAMAAVVDDGGLYPPDLLRGGARLDRVLVVPARTPLGTARVVDLLVRSRACRLVVMTAPDLRAAVWTRLAELAHRSGVLVIAIAVRAPAALAHAAMVRLECTRERLVMAGSHGLWAAIAGYDVRADLRKHKRFTTGTHARVRVLESFDGAILRERAIAKDSEVRARAALR